jgi:cation transport ATPase
MKTDTTNEQVEDFKTRIKNISDAEIVSILQYREQFQQFAVEIAINEALHRNIITSKNDLDKPEFQHKPSNKKTLFPMASNDAYTFGIFKSLCRIAYFYGIIPVAYAVFQLIKGEYLYALAAIIASLGIGYTVYKLEKTFNIFYSNLLLLVNIATITLSVYYLHSYKQHSSMDVFAIGCVVVITLYITFYLRKLSAYFFYKKK